MSSCIKKIKTDECIKSRDDGYSRCSNWADEGSNECSDWSEKHCHWYSPWNCIAGWFCQAFYWVANVICKGWEWIKNIVCVVWKYITQFICVVVDVCTSIFNSLISILDFVFSIVGGIIAFVINIITSIPFIGRAIEWVLNIIKTAYYAVASIPDAVLTLLGIMPEKKLKLLVIVQNDSERKPVVSNINVVYRDIQYLANTFREQMNIRLLPTNLFVYRSAFSSDSNSLENFVKVDDSVSGDRTLDVCCDSCAAGDDLTSIGSGFNLMMARLGFSTDARRLIGYGAPIIAFAVRSYTDGKAGCSLGPLSDYVTVKFNELNNGGIYPGGSFVPINDLTSDKSLDSVTDLAHEVGHCCNLPHYEGQNNNLMNPKPNRTGHLTVWQKILVRSSRHVTYL
jgi:hypothetical protein